MMIVGQALQIIFKNSDPVIGSLGSPYNATLSCHTAANSATNPYIYSHVLLTTWAIIQSCGQMCLMRGVIISTLHTTCTRHTSSLLI